MSKDIAIGIDLGTTNTVVAAVRDNAFEVVRTDGALLIPSVVSFMPNGRVLIGQSAKERRVIDARNTVFSAKRLIGQPYAAPHVTDIVSTLPYCVIEGENQECLVKTRAGTHSIPELSGFVLGYARSAAEKALGQEVRRCVITVPANFSDSQRQATAMAAEAAGLEPLRILNEPTAAALAYGSGRTQHQRIAVFDLGGGTFDMTVLALRGDMVEVVATGGETFLGGDDMDRQLALHLAEQFLRQTRVDLTQHPETSARLLKEAENIKQLLSDRDEVDVTLEELTYGLEGKPVGMRVRLTREVFEAMIAPIVDRALACAQGVLYEAGMAPQTIDEIVLAGGGTKVPLVTRKVAALFGREPRSDIDPMVVVATGAALHADNLVNPTSAGKTPTTLLDVTSHALGIGTAGGYSEALIGKNTVIPVESSRVFTTALDGQTTVRIRVCQGAERRFEDNRAIGELVLDQLRAAPRGDVKVEVHFLVDANGMLSVTARDVESGLSTQATLSILGLATQVSPELPS